MNFTSSYQEVRLAPRCRLITSWWGIIYQGFGCSPIKVVHELGLERRETVWSLSTVFTKKLVNFDSSTRGPIRDNLWYTDCFKKALSESYVIWW